MDKYEYTLHKIKLILEKKRENYPMSHEKMLTKEFIDDDEMIEIQQYKKIYKLARWYDTWFSTYRKSI